jgi:hypothetical protein
MKGQKIKFSPEKKTQRKKYSQADVSQLRKDLPQEKSL